MLYISLQRPKLFQNNVFLFSQINPTIPFKTPFLRSPRPAPPNFSPPPHPHQPFPSSPLNSVRTSAPQQQPYREKKKKRERPGRRNRLTRTSRIDFQRRLITLRFSRALYVGRMPRDQSRRRAVSSRRRTVAGRIRFQS